MVKLLLASALAAATASAKNITAKCLPDNTINVVIHSDIAADILDVDYGSCDESSIGDAIDSNFNATGATKWEGTINPARCDMESNLRTLKYNQTAKFTVGKKDGSNKLVFATYEIDTYCEYTATYTVTFNYGDVNAANYDFDQSGGLVGLNFYFTSTDSDFNTTKAPSTTAGEKIYLTLKLNATANPNFDHAESVTSSSGKLFSPTKCIVMDTANSNANYTLFEGTSEADCTNDFIDLSVSYQGTSNGTKEPQWNISHDLFLLNNVNKSTYTLVCDVIVCHIGLDWTNNPCINVGDSCNAENFWDQ